MKFDRITENGKLWATRYDGDDDNILSRLFEQWSDTEWLYRFFTEHFDDLGRWWHIQTVSEAVRKTTEDSLDLQELMLEIDTDDLDRLFRHLDDEQVGDKELDKEKAKLEHDSRVKSWLRLYAIKLAENTYVITGGAIKLTYKMEERRHTADELTRLDMVRNFLLEQGVSDDDGFFEYVES